MKKSLFKRVLATVSSVPFALSQCLTYTSYAVTSDSVQSPVEQAESSSHSLNFYDTFLYIAEDDDDNHSNWDDNVYFALQSLGIKGTSGYIEKSVVADTILAHAGKYADKAQLAIDMIDDNGIKYEVTNTGDIVISGRLNDPDFSELALIKKANAGIVERFDEIEADIKRKYKENTDKLHEQYGVNVEEDLPDLENIDKEMLAQKYGIPASVLDSMPLTKEEISERYDVPLDLMEDVKSIEDINDEVLDIPKFDFSGIKFSGTYEIKIKASDLMTGDRTMSISASYTPDETGTPLSLGDAADFALKKVDEMHDSAEETLNKVASVKEAVEAADNARKTFNKQFNTLRKYINKVKNNQDRVTTINYGPVTADNFADLADKLNEKIENNKMVDKVENKLDKDIKIPSTAQAIVNNNIVKELFDVIIEQINIATAESGLSVNISLDVIAQFIDNDLYALMAQASSGTYELNGQFIDEKVPDSEYTRYLKATVDVGDIYSTNYNLATIGLDIWREPIVTTTTTTTTDDTTTTTTTSETTGTDETTETTTTSETTGTDETTETTTTSETTGTDETTETTTTSETTGTDETTETTTTTETTGTDDPSSTTTTTETTGTGETTDSTTTSVTTGSGPVLNGEVKNWSVAIDPSGFGTGSGFYYSHETSFRKEQVKGITLHVDYVDDTLESSEFDISENFDFASTPAETFIYGDADFKYVATLVYRGGDVVDDHGNVVIKDGDVLKTKTNEDAGVEVYIGIMGDVDLDYMVNAVDATQILMYYASLSTGKGQNETILSRTNPKLVTDPLCIYDQFAAFLGDVNQANFQVEENWKTGKVGRLMDATDSTSILSYYAAVSTGKPQGIETWDSILGK